jgi:hypothetical protein
LFRHKKATSFGFAIQFKVQPYYNFCNCFLKERKFCVCQYGQLGVFADKLFLLPAGRQMLAANFTNKSRSEKWRRGHAAAKQGL